MSVTPLLAAAVVDIRLEVANKLERLEDRGDRIQDRELHGKDSSLWVDDEGQSLESDLPGRPACAAKSSSWSGRCVLTPRTAVPWAANAVALSR